MQLRARLLALALSAATTLGGCASSRPAGADVDAVADDDGATSDGTAAVDGADPDPDGATPDGAGGPDGASADATAVDGATDAPTDAPTDANGCSTQPCSLFPQCGCTPPLTCDIDFTDLMGTACRAVNVPGTEASTCSTFSGARPASSARAGAATSTARPTATARSRGRCARSRSPTRWRSRSRAR
ncbi:MAG: hypothetical protein IPL61_06830 [Myxococcales bacterium]|nr:hypothetical protein [Myxococcales bacterium]